jgi:hypothetical protein
MLILADAALAEIDLANGDRREINAADDASTRYLADADARLEKHLAATI